MAQANSKQGVTTDRLSTLSVCADTVFLEVPFEERVKKIAVNLVKEVNSPHIKILFDIYHTSLEEGNVADLLRAYHHYIGHVHIADVPGRHEPGTGEINYPFLAKVLHEVGYKGAVGLEAFPLENGELALKRFQAAFTP